MNKISRWPEARKVGRSHLSGRTGKFLGFWRSVGKFLKFLFLHSGTSGRKNLYSLYSGAKRRKTFWGLHSGVKRWKKW